MLFRSFTPEEYSYEPDFAENRDIKKSDYDLVEVIPVSDPNSSTMAQRIMQYQAVIFDLDGTLVSEVDGVERATDQVAAALREHGHDVSGEALNAARLRVVRAADRTGYEHLVGQR